MPRHISHQTVACKDCGFKDAPTFKIEERIAYREQGSEQRGDYIRDTLLSERALVCIKCGAVQETLARAS